jgi:hypothetical protein
VIVITSPGSNSGNADLVIGTLRTTFSFWLCRLVVETYPSVTASPNRRNVSTRLCGLRKKAG